MKDEKIFENEILSDNELENISGGLPSQMVSDSRFLNSLNGSCDRYGALKVGMLNLFSGSISKEISKGWATVGIEAKVYSDVGLNQYYLDGKKITQKEAYQHAMEVTGHYMTEKDWNW